jgi:hypothetical protein
MKHSWRLTALCLLSGITSAKAQVRFTAGVDGGIAVPAGDLGRLTTSGPMVSASVRAGKPGSRTSFGAEAMYAKLQFKDLADDLTWRAYGVMARVEYTVTGGLYALGGAGMLYRERNPIGTPAVPDRFESTDPAAQAGLGLRVGRHLALEARVINIVTVNASERVFPFTVGVRF